METIYSIVYITLNTTLDERISIGVIMTNGLEYYFNYSSEKLLAVKNILDDAKYTVIKNYLKSIEKEIGFEKTTENQLLYKDTYKTAWVTEEYLSYLSNYSNNIIHFSKPKKIDIDLNSLNYKKIFEKYVFKIFDKKNEPEAIDVHAIVKHNLFPKIASNVNLEKIITSSDFDNLFAPIEVDFIGINGIPVAGQTIDFQKTSYYLENDVARFISLTKAIELQGKPKGQYYILGREPQKSTNKNYQLWKQIRGSNFLDFVDIDEVEQVEAYITQNNVRPFFEV